MEETFLSKENEEMNEENKEKLPADTSEEMEVTDVPAEAQESPPNSVEPPIPEEKNIMPLKKNNRFFLAALFPLLFIVVLGVILLISGFFSSRQEQGESTSPTEEPYYEIKAGEVRGVYVATAYNINYPSAPGLSADKLKEQIGDIIYTCSENGLNAVYFQVSPFSDALYHSDILPTSSVLTGKEGAPLPDGFDPLKYLCEKAHSQGIAVHAWVNPMRITAGDLDREDLSPKNPALTEPGYTVTYGGELYYDLGYPEVRNLQAKVCAELAGKYQIDGIIFDDYFYPYPIEGESFDDSASYKLHGAGYESVEDFRRASVTALVTECYDAIKATRPECQFGVAPFGIWRNDDGANGGSATRGMESYESIYCDSMAFVRSGKVDYIAPQIYWRFETEVAPYGELCDWWAEAVKDTDVKLLISHAAYRVEEWDDPTELTDQVEYARTKRDYYGSIFYGYEVIDEGQATAETFAHIYEGEK